MTNVSKAFFLEFIDLNKATPGVVQNTPTLTPGVENFALYKYFIITYKNIYFSIKYSLRCDY